MRILVTGSAGFIGSNLIHDLLGEAGAELGVKIEKVGSLDKLTYTGNPRNFTAIKNDDLYRFVHGDIGDTALVRKTLSEHDITASCISPPNPTSTDP